jgi:hypothetical protein
MTSLIEDAHSVAHQITRELHGEEVTLLASVGGTSTVIANAVVSLRPPAVTRDDGPVERDGTVRLAATHYDTAKAANRITLRGETWDIVSVGDKWADMFRLEVSLLDTTHPNLFDLSQEQPTWVE